MEEQKDNQNNQDAQAKGQEEPKKKKAPRKRRVQSDSRPGWSIEVYPYEVVDGKVKVNYGGMKGYPLQRCSGIKSAERSLVEMTKEKPELFEDRVVRIIQTHRTVFTKAKTQISFDVNP